MTFGREIQIAIPSEVLDRLLPMHVLLSEEGRILSAGPTLMRLRQNRQLVGDGFLDRFVIRRPPCIATMDDILALDGRRLRLEFADPPHTAMNAQCLPLGDGRVIVDMSFGINVAAAVAEYGLDHADFAPTSLAIEMLYLIEAKTAAIGELRELTERLAAEKSLAEKKAETDSLTGVLNRRGVEACLEKLIDEGAGFGLLHIDLDFFKSVNDTHGHAAGDEVLVRVARILNTMTRPTDRIGRLGGDEFLIVVPGVVDAELLRAMAAQIIGTLDKPFDFAGKVLRISASAGVTSSASYANPEIARMIEDADRALYRSKLDGRTRATVFDPATMGATPGPDVPRSAAGLV